MTRDWRKPKFSLAEWQRVEPFLREMRDYLLRYTPTDWQHVASDVLDGWALPEDVAPLVRRRLLRVIHDRGCGCKHRCAEGAGYLDECGARGPTWYLTDRGRYLLTGSLPAKSTSLQETGE